MREEAFEKIQSALRTAMCEPDSAPSALVARTALRCETVLSGREAENRLRQEPNLPAEEVYSLTAAGLLGRLAFTRQLPMTGQSFAEMQKQLASSEWFQGKLNGTVENALCSLRSGSLLNSAPEQEKLLRPKVPVHKQGPKTMGGR